MRGGEKMRGGRGREGDERRERGREDERVGRGYTCTMYMYGRVLRKGCVGWVFEMECMYGGKVKKKGMQESILELNNENHTSTVHKR